jgi:putative ABC transport system permease protein
MTGWRTALRIAWREARRAKGRALLVVAMIALPVAALTLGAVTQDTFDLTPRERADRLMGTAQAVVTWPQEGEVQQVPDELHAFGFITRRAETGQPEAERVAEPSEERLLALLPPGATAITDQRTRLNLQTATGTAPIATRLLDYADPLAHGIYRQQSGRAPAAADEVALTIAASQRLNAREGGTIRFADGSHTFRVVGVVEDPSDLRAPTVVMRPDALPPDAARDLNPRMTNWLVATPGPLTWNQVKQLNTHGVIAISRHVLANPPSAAELYPDLVFQDRDEGPTIAVIVGGLAMLEIVLLAGPAFAVGARRRRRDLALVAAAGGRPAHIRRIVLADGVVLGGLAGAAGLVLGIAAAAIGRPLFEEYVSHTRSGDFRVFPLALAVLAVLAVTTGVLAALVPAWISSRQDVVTALAGRRGITRSGRRWVVLGGLLAAAGAALAAVGAWRVNATLILIGLVIAEFGLVFCTPAIVGLVARTGRWLPLAPRIALRDASRNRTAAAPAISAVMAAVVGTLAVGVVFSASVEREQRDYRTLSQPGDVALSADLKLGGPDQPSIPPQAVTALRDAMPVDQIHELSMPSCGGECFVQVLVPAERACPYLPDRGRPDLTPDEQRAARSDSRCADIGARYRYFGGFGFPDGIVFVLDEAALAAVAKIPAEDVDAVAAAMRSGAVVVDSDRYLTDGRVTLRVRAGPGKQTRDVTAPGFLLPSRPRAPIALMSKQTADSLGFEPSPMAVVATTTRMPTVEEEDRLRAALGNEVFASVERGPNSNWQMLVTLAIVAGVITLSATAIATGLAAADGRADLATLGAVGASPRVRRALSLSQSGVIAGLGSLLGAAVGLGASIAVLVALNQGYAQIWPAPTPYPIVVPWFNVAIAVLVVPLIAMLGAGLLTRSRLPIERRL